MLYKAEFFLFEETYITGSPLSELMLEPPNMWILLYELAVHRNQIFYLKEFEQSKVK